LRLDARASVAKTNNAKAFLSVHFNASSDHSGRGTSCNIDRKYSKAVYIDPDTKISSGPGDPKSGLRNTNVEKDEAFAFAIAKATVRILRKHDPKAYLRGEPYTAAKHGEKYAPPDGVKMKGLGVLNEGSLGPTPVAGLLEVDFLDNKDFDRVWNGKDGTKVRDEVADAIAEVLVDFTGPDE
jgi:N-acetylmuramoyl-L-alanine amidase